MGVAGHNFEDMLSGGYPNSLGRVEEVVDIVLNDRDSLDELFGCYGSNDEVIRLRVSSCLKRVFREERDWFLDYIDEFHRVVPALFQPSALWTLAQLHLELENLLSASQKRVAIEITKRQLRDCDDWIVIIQSVNLLEHWSKTDKSLRSWTLKTLEGFVGDNRKSVSKRVGKSLKLLSNMEA